MTPVDLNGRDAQNLLEAASAGAAISVKVVANIAANLIAFLAVLAFINAALSWLGDMVDIQGLNFQVWLWWRGMVSGQGMIGGHPTQFSCPFILSSSAPTSCGLWPS